MGKHGKPSLVGLVTGAIAGLAIITPASGREIHFVPKVKVEVAVPDELAEQVVGAIQEHANTDKIGDGKIFVLDLGQAIRIRTGETDAEAL